MPFDGTKTYTTKREAWSASSKIRTLEEAQAWYSATEDLTNLVASEDWIEKAFNLARDNVRARIGFTLKRRGLA